MKAEILLFNTDPVTRQRIVNTVKPMMISVRAVSEKDHDRKLCEICGLPEMAEDTGEEKNGNASVDAPMMVFAAIPDSLLFIILDKLKENGIRIPHKAALTPTNMGWTPAELFAEIHKEVEAFAARQTDSR